MLAFSELGDARSDVVSILALIPGWNTAKANAWFSSLEALIEAKARAGAAAEIPEIEAKVRAAAEEAAAKGARGALTPVIIGLSVVGALSLLASSYAVYRAKHR